VVDIEAAQGGKLEDKRPRGQVWLTGRFKSRKAEGFTVVAKEEGEYEVKVGGLGDSEAERLEVQCGHQRSK
jgi:hypothetical protein